MESNQIYNVHGTPFRSIHQQEALPNDAQEVSTLHLPQQHQPEK